MSETDRIVIEQATTATDDVRTLVGELEAALAAHYLPHQRHGLKLEAIFRPHVRFFVARMDGAPAGCGGVALFDGFAEVKRMYVRESARGRGVSDALLARLEATARKAGYDWLRLETGNKQFAAMRFYRRAGFQECSGFGDYLQMTPEALETSVFMEKQLAHPPIDCKIQSDST